jgi:outer membrane protein
MKTRSIGIAIAAGLLAAAAGTASADSYKVGYVNADRVMRESRESQQLAKGLEAEFKKRQQEIAGGPKADVEKNMRALSDEMNARQEEARKQFIAKASAAIRRIGEQGDFDAVFLEAAYATAGVDLTDKVIRALDAGR